MLLIALLVALAAAWLADNGGIVTLTIANYEIRTSAALGAVLLLALGILVAALFKVMMLIVGGPARLSTFLIHRRAGKAYHALSRGLVAAAAGDAHDAAHAAGHVEKLLGGNPLVLLLRARAAELSRDEGQQQAAYTAMLAHSETEFLGARGLADLAMRRGNSEQAVGFALRAHALKPKSEPAAEALFQLRISRGERAEAQALLDEELQAKRLSPETERRWREALGSLEAAAVAAPQTAVPLPAEQC
jgi:HemY protein